MNDKLLKQYGEMAVKAGVNIQPGQTLIINAPITAADLVHHCATAAYDAGARTILSWSFRAGEACDYRMQCPDLGWHIIGDAMAKIKWKHIDACLNKKREERLIK